MRSFCPKGYIHGIILSTVLDYDILLRIDFDFSLVDFESGCADTRANLEMVVRNQEVTG